MNLDEVKKVYTHLRSIQHRLISVQMPYGYAVHINEELAAAIAIVEQRGKEMEKKTPAVRPGR
jgi:hypothetical protein